MLNYPEQNGDFAKEWVLTHSFYWASEGLNGQSEHYQKDLGRI